MRRFALTVTAIEVVLTLGTSALIAFADTGEPFLTQDDLRMLGLPYKDHATWTGWRISASRSYETRVELLDSGQALSVSHRVDVDPSSFGERYDKELAGTPGESVTILEPYPAESGYCVRHTGPTSARSELVRLRGSEMLVIKVIKKNLAPGRSRMEVARCERLARLAQHVMLEKMGWR